MDTALANSSQQSAPAPGLANIPVRQILTLLAGVAALAAIVVASVNWARTPDYKVLFANLSDRDGGSVVATLTQMNVPYKFAEGGGAILVPGSQVHEARLKLASQGLPKGGTVGFELMENQRFGVTQFQERLNFQRGLEGELARSVQALSAVERARVHLALPSQNGFLREQQKPSASVLLTLHPGRVLDRAQIAGIVHLVASSVPELSPKLVSVIDQSGALLSGNGDAAGSTGLDPGQLGYVRQIEGGYMRRIIDILEPIVGRDNVRAQVTADVDFTQSESTAEQYRPNQGAEPAAVRSQQVTEASEKSGGGTAQGVPGALSNQPPPAAIAPINGPAQAMQAAGQSAGGAGANAKREAVTNYELDKTVRVVRNGTGTIKRLTAAVVLNHRKTVDADGNVTWTPLAPAELENVNALVREAIGFSKERGDSLNVVNAPFSREAPPKEIELPLWKQPETVEIAKEAGRYAGLLLLALTVIFAVVRPALRSLGPGGLRPAGSPLLSATVQNDVALPAPPNVAASPAAVGGPDMVMKLAKENPAAVASVVRGWVGSEK